MGLRERLAEGGRGRSDKARLDALEARVVWMLGSPRTGTTWLINLLARRDGIVMLDEPGIGVQLGQFSHDFFGSPAANFSPAQTLMSGQRRADRHYFFADEYSEVWRPALRALMLRRFEAQLERAGAPGAVCLVKEPNGSQAAEMLAETLPGSRLMWVLRDGRDVVDSEVDGIQPGGWMEEYGATWAMTDAERRRFIEDRAWRWVRRQEAVQTVYEQLPAAQRHQVRYETLRTDTAAQLLRTLEWLGEPSSPEEAETLAQSASFERLPKDLTGTGKFTRSAKVGGWRENMSAADQETMQRIMGPKLAELDYR